MKKEIIPLLFDFIDRRELFPKVRRILSGLLNISIAHFLYVHFQGPYELLEISDYHGIINYFLKGGFFVALTYLAMAYGVSYILSMPVFPIAKELRTKKVRTFFNDKVLEGISTNDQTNLVHEIKQRLIQEKFATNVFTIAIATLIQRIDEREYELLSELANERQHIIQENTELSCRIILASIIYYAVIPEFGVWLLVLWVAAASFYIWASSYSYALYYVLPALIAKNNEVAENALRKFLGKADS